MRAAKAHLLAAKDRQQASQDPAEPSGDSNRPHRAVRSHAGGDGGSEGGSEGGAGGAKQSSRGEASHYLHDVKSSRAQMRRPSESSSLSWR